MAVPAGTRISACPNKGNDEMRRKTHFQIRDSGYKAIILHAYRKVTPYRLWFLQGFGPQRYCMLPWLCAYKENIYQLISFCDLQHMDRSTTDTPKILHWECKWLPSTPTNCLPLEMCEWEVVSWYYPPQTFPKTFWEVDVKTLDHQDPGMYSS